MFKTYYDPITDKIYGAKKGSIMWHHEDRHRQQVKSGKGSLFEMWSIYFLIGAVWFSIFENEPIIFAKFFIIISVLCLVYLEIDAWIYTIRKICSPKFTFRTKLSHTSYGKGT